MGCAKVHSGICAFVYAKRSYFSGLRVKYVPAGCYNTLCVSLRVKYVPVMVQLSFIGQGL